METQLTGMLIGKRGQQAIQVFGYSSKGNPGLEILGASNKFGKLVKEKFIYLTKSRRLKIPTRRYVICIELDETDALDAESLAWLELPLLLMFWTLSDQLPIYDLKDCLTVGRVDISGEIVLPYLHPELLSQMAQEHERRFSSSLKLITGENYKEDFSSQNIYLLPIEEIFSGFGESLKFSFVR